MAGPTMAMPRAADDLLPDLSGHALTRFANFATLPDSRGLDAPSIVHGALVDPAGAALGGAHILLAAWPSSDTIDALPAGGEFDVLPVARTVSGRDGTYALNAALTPALALLAGENGIDVELNVFHRDHHYVFLSQVKPQLDTASWGANLLTAALVPSVRDSVEGALTLTLDPASGENLNAAVPVRLGRNEPPITEGDLFGYPCGTWRKLGRTSAMTTVATAAVYNGPSVTTTYETGAQTTTSTGLSVDGAISFSISGARTRSARFTAGFYDLDSGPGEIKGREYRVEISHQILRRACTAGPEVRNGRYSVHYVTSPRRMTGGFDHITPRLTPTTCRHKYTARTRGPFTRYETEEAATYTSAFSINPMGRGSFTGAALSGYSKAVKLEFRFDGRGGNRACGHTDKPGTPGQRITAFQK
ncbi:MAG: hypothetical protein ACT4PP_15080 [Sporichthyaceae bacterium]